MPKKSVSEKVAWGFAFLPWGLTLLLGIEVAVGREFGGDSGLYLGLRLASVLLGAVATFVSPVVIIVLNRREEKRRKRHGQLRSRAGCLQGVVWATGIILPLVFAFAFVILGAFAPSP